MEAQGTAASALSSPTRTVLPSPMSCFCTLGKEMSRSGWRRGREWRGGARAGLWRQGQGGAGDGGCSFLEQFPQPDWPRRRPATQPHQLRLHRGPPGQFPFAKRQLHSAMMIFTQQLHRRSNLLAPPRIGVSPNLRFLLLAATTVNAGRIISQIREQLKFVGVVDPRAARSKKLKGKASATSTDGAILHALRSGLRFKNMLCEAFLKELKSVDHPKDHKVIDVWLIMLIYANGGALQKSAEKILKSKILQGYIRDTLFNQCILGNTELVKDHFMSYLSVSDYLLACKEEKAREFATYLFTALFEEFNDTFSRQELIGSLITHIGSGVSYEVSSALDIMISLTSNHSEELIPIASHIPGLEAAYYHGK